MGVKADSYMCLILEEYKIRCLLKNLSFGLSLHNTQGMYYGVR